MIRKNSQQDFEYYASQLKKPVWKFILLNGLAWAIPVMIIMIPLNYLIADGPANLNLQNLLLQIGIWVLGGLLYGWLMRIFFARKFRSMKKTQQFRESGS